MLHGRGLGLGLAGIVAVAAPSAIAADDAAFVQRVNAIYEGRDRAVPDDLRADLIVLRAVAGMEEAPASVPTPLHAALLTPKSSGWSEAEAWAAAPSQQAAIEAVRKVGEPGKRYAYLQPYGANGVDASLRAEGLFTDLGEPPILAAARFEHLKGLSRLGRLVQVEATRLGEMGKANEALTLTVAWTHFARMIADREFVPEVRWGLRNMVIGLQRTLDVVRTYGDKLTDVEIGNAIESISPRNLGLDRLRLPKGERIAGEQILARAFDPRGGPNASGFGSTMALVSSAERPLLQFGEAARWQDSASGHAGTFDTADMLAGVFKDFELRWGLRPDDRILATKSDWERMDKGRYAVVAEVAKDYPDLFTARQRVLAEAAGARMALAAAAFKARYNTFPVALSAARPAYIKTVEKDPYSLKDEEYHYFVPIRDQPRGPRDLPKPHSIRVGGADAEQHQPVIPDEITEDALRGALEVVAPREDAERKFAAAIKAAQFDRSRIGPAVSEFFSALVGPSVGAILGDTAFWSQIMSAYQTKEPTAAEAYSAMLSQLHSQLKQKNQLRQAYEELLERRPKPRPSGLAGPGDAAMGGADTFSAALDDSTFVLYSVGPNREREWAREVGEGGADLLIWPPVISLLREQVRSTSVDPRELTGPWVLHDLMPAQERAADTGGKDAKTEEAPAAAPSGPTRFPGG